MPVRVTETPLATAQVAGMRGQARKAYDRFLDDLSATGCAALGYRLTGPEPLPRLCVKHLRGTDRVVVAFADDGAWVVLVGKHDNSDPGLNVYTSLYTLAGVRPEDQHTRTKPPCCDDGEPPMMSEDEVQSLVDRAKALRKEGRRSR